MPDAPRFQSNDPQDTPPRATSGLSWFVPLAGLITLGLLLFVFWPRDRGRYGAHHPAVGNAPARWQLEPLTGDSPPIDLAALEGKVTVVNFWGTWCPPCEAEFPHVVQLWQELRAEPDFQLAAVSCEPGIETDIDRLRRETAKFLADRDTDMPTYYDPQGISRVATMDTTGEELAFPATVIFGRDGTLQGYWRGYRPGMEREIEALTRRLLAQQE